jgi:hypothetical protein
VLQFTDWMIADGVNAQKQPIHDPGAEAYLAWHAQQAKRGDALFAVMVTMPELIEADPDGSFRAVLVRDFVLAQHLPCWVGPKDESVYVYVPKP